MELGGTKCPDAPVGPLPQVFVRQVGFIEDVADDLLNDVLERNDALEVAVLIDDQRHVTARLPKGAQQRIERHGFRNDNRVVHESFPLDRLVARGDQLRQQFLGEDDAGHLVQFAGRRKREPAVARFANGPHDIAGAVLRRQYRHFLSRNHHVGRVEFT